MAWSAACGHWLRCAMRAAFRSIWARSPGRTGDVHLAEVQQWVAAVQFKVAVDDLGVVLERDQVCLVVRIREGRIVRMRGGQRRQALPDPRGRQVLDDAVVLVPPGRLARLRHVEVAQRAHPRAQFTAIHAPRRYRSPRGRDQRATIKETVFVGPVLGRAMPAGRAQQKGAQDAGAQGPVPERLRRSAPASPSARSPCPRSMRGTNGRCRTPPCCPAGTPSASAR